MWPYLSLGVLERREQHRDGQGVVGSGAIMAQEHGRSILK